AVPVPEDQLPVILPDIEDYAPKGKPPLAQNEEYMAVDCPECGGAARRDPDTMDTFVDSSWYFLRYIDSHNDEAPFDRFVVDYWAPVSQYIGGIDHATGHPLYSAFLLKARNDWGTVGWPGARRRRASARTPWRARRTRRSRRSPMMFSGASSSTRRSRLSWSS